MDAQTSFFLNQGGGKEARSKNSAAAYLTVQSQPLGCFSGASEGLAAPKPRARQHLPSPPPSVSFLQAFLEDIKFELVKLS